MFTRLLRAVQLNQATVFLTLLLAVAWIALQRKLNVIAGIALAMAMALKPQIVLILPFLLWSSRRAVFWAIFTGGALLILSIIYAGPENHIYYAAKIVPMLSAGYSFYPNQSFNGFCNRIFLDYPIHIFALAPKTAAVQTLTIVFGLLTYCTGLGIAWRQRHKKNMAPSALRLGLVDHDLDFTHIMGASLCTGVVCFRLDLPAIRACR